jgi:4-hydroxybutyryl-CoA dehydratase/vinylacetyl-CoA-Delta-isomerase
MHGAGSPQAQRVQMARQAQLEFRKGLARKLAGIRNDEDAQSDEEIPGYLGRVFKPENIG